MTVLSGKGSKSRLFLLAAFIGLLVMAFVVPSLVAAQDHDIDVIIDQTSQKADFTVDDSITISITGSFEVNSYAGRAYFGITAPDGWLTSISPEEAGVTPGSSVSFEGTVIPDEDAVPEDFTVIVWASTKQIDSGDHPDFDAPTTYSGTSIIEIIQNRVMLISQVLEQRALPNATISYAFTVTNVATVEDTFYILLMNDEVLKANGWLISKSDESLTLEPEETKTFYVEQEIPLNAEVGDYPVNVIVSSSGDMESVRSLSMVTKVRIPQITEPFWTLGLILMITFVGTGIGLATFIGVTEIGYLALLSLFLPLYVRLKKKDVLSHFTRGQIFGFIQANPGTHYNAVIQHLGLNNGVGAYHLQVLEREGYIKSLRDGIYKRFYPTGVKIPEKKLHLSRLQRDILMEIQRHPGVTQKQISKLLDESKQVVNYHVKILESAGLIRLERIGRETACFTGRMRYVSEKDAYEVADEGLTQVMNI